MKWVVLVKHFIKKNLRGEIINSYEKKSNLHTKSIIGKIEIRKSHMQKVRTNQGPFCSKNPALGNFVFKLEQYSESYPTTKALLIFLGLLFHTMNYFWFRPRFTKFYLSTSPNTISIVKHSYLKKIYGVDNIPHGNLFSLEINDLDAILVEISRFRILFHWFRHLFRRFSIYFTRFILLYYI